MEDSSSVLGSGLESITMGDGLRADSAFWDDSDSSIMGDRGNDGRALIWGELGRVWAGEGREKVVAVWAV